MRKYVATLVLLLCALVASVRPIVAQEAPPEGLPCVRAEKPDWSWIFAEACGIYLPYIAVGEGWKIYLRATVLPNLETPRLHYLVRWFGNDGAWFSLRILLSNGEFANAASTSVNISRTSRPLEILYVLNAPLKSGWIQIDVNAPLGKPVPLAMSVRLVLEREGKVIYEIPVDNTLPARNFSFTCFQDLSLQSDCGISLANPGGSQIGTVRISLCDNGVAVFKTSSPIVLPPQEMRTNMLSELILLRAGGIAKVCVTSDTPTLLFVVQSERKEDENGAFKTEMRTVYPPRRAADTPPD